MVVITIFENNKILIIRLGQAIAWYTEGEILMIANVLNKLAVYDLIAIIYIIVGISC